MNREDTISNISSYYRVKPKQTSKISKQLNSDYRLYKYQRRDSINQIFPENIGSQLHIDEVAISRGELYTIVTNPEGRAKRGTIVAIIEGTTVKKITEVLEKLALVRRKQVKAVSLDMAPNMSSAIRKCFPNAELVIDKFHVVKLVCDALQAQRVEYRWKILDLENTRLNFCKQHSFPYQVKQYSNGDTEKQLLARSVHLLYKSREKWTESQHARASILFKNYPLLKTMYNHVQAFRAIYSHHDIESAEIALDEWLEKSSKKNLKVFNIAGNTILTHKRNILNYYKYRITNAFAESFNAKIKRFRFLLKGVTDRVFFQYRLVNLFA